MSDTAVPYQFVGLYKSFDLPIAVHVADIIIIIIRQLIRLRNMSIKSLQGRRCSCIVG